MEVMNELSGYSEDVQSHGSGLPSPILVTVMADSQPISIGNVLANDVASAEMMTNVKYVGRCKPIDRADQVVSPDTTEQPIWLGLNTDARRNTSADTGALTSNRLNRENRLTGWSRWSCSVRRCMKTNTPQWTQWAMTLI